MALVITPEAIIKRLCSRLDVSRIEVWYGGPTSPSRTAYGAAVVWEQNAGDMGDQPMGHGPTLLVALHALEWSINHAA